MSAYSTPPTENVARGAVFSLIVIPVGIVAWVTIWNLGYIAAIVALGIAFGAFWLYKFGAGTIGIPGAIVITLVTLLTVVLAFFSGVVWDYAVMTADEVGGTVTEYVFDPSFIRLVLEDLFTYGGFEFYQTDFLIALGLAALGAGGLVVRAFREARRPAETAVWPTQATEPIAPPEPEAKA
jgi:hypothetical protein